MLDVEASSDEDQEHVTLSLKQGIDFLDPSLSIPVIPWTVPLTLRLFMWKTPSQVEHQPNIYKEG